MANIAIRLGGAPELEAHLAERIYEYNAATTGYHDVELFSAAQATESGAVEAGISGYTWGGCCFVSQLWVAERSRRKGLGTELLRRSKITPVAGAADWSFCPLTASKRQSSTLGRDTSRWRASK